MMKHLLLPGILWGASFLLSSCAQQPLEDPNKHQDGSYRSTLVTGRFEGFPDYRNWVVYLSGFNYKSTLHKVDADGGFTIRAVNIPKGRYSLIFGHMKAKSRGSMKVWIDSSRTHLGVIKAGQ